LLFRWFVGLSLDEAVWDATVFTKNRERLIEGDIARRFMTAVLASVAKATELRHTSYQNYNLYTAGGFGEPLAIVGWRTLEFPRKVLGLFRRRAFYITYRLVVRGKAGFVRTFNRLSRGPVREQFGESIRTRREPASCSLTRPSSSVT
jgi:hypothetical protein